MGDSRRARTESLANMVPTRAKRPVSLRKSISRMSPYQSCHTNRSSVTLWFFTCFVLLGQASFRDRRTDSSLVLASEKKRIDVRKTTAMLLVLLQLTVSLTAQNISIEDT